MQKWLQRLGLALAGTFIAVGAPIVPVESGYIVRNAPVDEANTVFAPRSYDISRLKETKVVGEACYNQWDAIDKTKKSIRERISCDTYKHYSLTVGPDIEGYEWTGYKTFLYDTPSGDLEPGYYAKNSEIPKKWLTPLQALTPIAEAAIALTDSSIRGDPGNVSSYSYNHTAGSGDVLYVGVNAANQSGSISSVTFNGDSLTSLFNTGSSNLDTSMWFLATPDAGTFSVAVTLSTTFSYNGSGALSFSGAATSPGTTNNNTSLTLSVTATEQSWVVDIQTSNSNSTNAPASSQTELFDMGAYASAGAGAMGYKGPNSAGSVAMNWTNSNATNNITHFVVVVPEACDPSATRCIDYITTTGYSTWTVPADITSVDIACWGPGGAGFDGGTTGGGAGGGGGGFASSTESVTPGDTIRFFVGTGGATSGASGSAASTASTTAPTLIVSADRGTGGTGAVTPVGSGGTSNTGDVTANGGNGGQGIDNGTHDGGGGGGGAGGPGGAGNTGQNAQSATGGAGGSGSNGTGGTAGTAGNPGAGGAGGNSNNGGGGGGGGDNGGAGGAGGLPGGGGGGGETGQGNGRNGQCEVAYQEGGGPPVSTGGTPNFFLKGKAFIKGILFKK